MEDHERANVERYLNEHFVPVVQAVNARGIPKELVPLAVEQATRHIYHWLGDEDRKAMLQAMPQSSDVEDDAGGDGGAPAEPEVEVVTETERERQERYLAAKAENRVPDEWVTGDEPATPRQLEVLRDRFIPHEEGISKAEASRLITAFMSGAAAGGAEA